MIVVHLIQLSIQYFNKDSPESLQTRHEWCDRDASLCAAGIASVSPVAVQKKKIQKTNIAISK